ncbi:MAG: AAA family ATPase [Solirubrobacteraceae bacterium]|nr:AAA family ATPase [Solirubrobacteraceae bacterium]
MAKRRAPDRSQPFVRRAELPELPEGDDAEAFPWNTIAARALHESGLELHPRCTFLVGANGSGKSTILEAIAEAAGLGVRGGGSGFKGNAVDEGEDSLGAALTLVRGARRPRTDFFLRAEGMLGLGDRIEQMIEEAHIGGYSIGDPHAAYGGGPLNAQSHGESFLAIINHRLGPDGLYLLDEPESALSPQSLLALLARMHDLLGEGCQFIVATHSPILLALPNSSIVEVTESGLAEIGYDDVEAVQLTRLVLDDPAAMMRRLLEG